MAHDLTHLVNLKQLKALGTKVKGSLDTLFGRTTGLELHNAGSHNAIYRGKNLGTEPTAAQWAAIKAGTFEDLYIGDYWQKEVTYDFPDPANDDALTSITATHKVLIADFDTFWGIHKDDSSDIHVHHIIVVPEVSIGVYCPWHNETDAHVGYGNSKAKNVYTDIGGYNFFKAFFGDSHLVSFNIQVPMTASTTELKYSTSASTTMKTCLLNSYMIHGNNENTFTFHWYNNSQLALFRLSQPDQRSGSIWWTADLYNNQNGNYVSVNWPGNMYYPSGEAITQSTRVKIRPFACIYQA